MIDEPEMWARAHVEICIDGEWRPALDAESAGRALKALTQEDRVPELVPDSGPLTVVRFKLVPHEIDELADWGDLAESSKEYRLHAWAED